MLNEISGDKRKSLRAAGISKAVPKDNWVTGWQLAYMSFLSGMALIKCLSKNFSIAP
jgi:hypothetical protein